MSNITTAGAQLAAVVDALNEGDVDRAEELAADADTACTAALDSGATVDEIRQSAGLTR